jgi:hypothetical protein
MNKTVIYIDTQKIASVKKEVENNVLILNSNYEKVKRYGFDCDICFLASQYRDKKEDFRNAIKDHFLQKDFYNKQELNSRIKEVEKAFFYNEFDSSGTMEQNEKYNETVKLNVKQIHCFFGRNFNLLIEFCEETETFILCEDYVEKIEKSFTYSCQNEKQEKVFELINEIKTATNEIKKYYPYFNITLESNYKVSEMYSLINSIK